MDTLRSWFSECMTLFSDSAAIGQGRLVARTRHEASENVSRKITGSQVVEKLLPNFSSIGGTKNSIAFNSRVCLHKCVLHWKLLRFSYLKITKSKKSQHCNLFQAFVVPILDAGRAVLLLWGLHLLRLHCCLCVQILLQEVQKGWSSKIEDRLKWNFQFNKHKWD